MVYRLLDVCLGNMLIAWGKKTPRCKACKKRMEKRQRFWLFLLPLFHDAEYEESAEYYRRNCSPISNVEEIPIGQRTCRMWVLDCPNCGARRILVEDFLRVRGSEAIEKRNTYEYTELSSLLSAGAGAENKKSTGIRQDFSARDFHVHD